MKKLISLLLALVLVFAACLPAALGEKAPEEGKKAEAVSVKNKKAVSDTVTLKLSDTKSNKAGKKQKAEKCTIYVGQTLKLKADTKKEVKWTSSDESIASVTGKNKVVAKKHGKVTLKGKAGSKEFKVNLSVNKIMKASTKEVSVGVGSEKTVTFTFKEAGYLTAKVSNTNIIQAYWDSNWNSGTIKLHLVGLKKGSAYVTVTNSVNSESIKVKVTVTKASSGTKYRALLIGNSNYSRNPLPNHKWDVKAMNGLLTKSLKKKYTVKTKYNASASGILSGIRSAFSGADSNDVSLFYYGGHGVAYSGALCGTDGGYVSPEQLRNALLKVPGKVIVILDCCHSGSMVTNNGAGDDREKNSSSSNFNNAVVNALSGYTIPAQSDGDQPNTGELRESKFIVLTACEKYEESWNWWYYGSYADQSFGTFTKTMFNGLGCKWSSGVYKGSAPCDKNHNGIATLGECYSYIRNRATKLNQQMGGSNVQHCMYYGDKNYPLFQLK